MCLSHRSRLQGPRVDDLECEAKPYQAALAFRLYKVPTTLSHASAKRITSSFVVDHPKLTRKTPSARAGSTPMASSTCDRLTFPDEQAEPEDRATPARSKAINAVSALRPGMAKAKVLGNRSAAEATTSASGAIRRICASASAFKAPSRPASCSRFASASSAAAP